MTDRSWIDSEGRLWIVPEDVPPTSHKARPDAPLGIVDGKAVSRLPADVREAAAGRFAAIRKERLRCDAIDAAYGRRNDRELPPDVRARVGAT